MTVAAAEGRTAGFATPSHQRRLVCGTSGRKPQNNGEVVTNVTPPFKLAKNIIICYYFNHVYF